MQLRVLHIIDSLQKGGAEKLLIDYINFIHDNFSEIQQFVLTPFSKTSDFDLPADIKWLPLQTGKWNFFSSIHIANRFIKENDINIIHAHLPASIFYSRLLTGEKVKRKIFTYHNKYYAKDFPYYVKWITFFERFTFRSSYFSIYVSDEVRKCIEKERFIKGEGTILMNFAHPSFDFKYQVSTKKELRIVMIANLRKTKNLELAVSEMTGLNNLPISIDIYGEGVLHDELQKKIAESKTNINLKGTISINSELLKCYDVFLITSLSEGLPVSLLEAMATGLPSVLPDHLHIFKEVANGAAFFYSIYKQGELSALLQNILENKQQLAELSRSAKDKSKIYSINNYVSQLVSIYNYCAYS